MSYKRIGDYIRLVNNRNNGLSVTNLLGVNIYKNFMPSVANISGVDLSKYKIIKKGQFATNIMHVNRDEILPVALYQKDIPAIVSPAYVTFEVVDSNELLPEFLMMEFQRPEFDRRAWTYCDSSVRGGLEWDRFCEMQIPIPDINEQKKYVSLYSGLLANQKTYQNSLDDLQLICNEYLENLRNEDNLKVLGRYISLADKRNSDLRLSLVRGVTTGKEFIKYNGNLNGIDLTRYKVVGKRQFVYVPDTGRRGEKIGIAMNQDEECLVSNIYTVFKVNSEQEILPEYLLLWFKRPEFDRYARFFSWGSVRELFGWEEMCNVKLPIPDIKVQEAIVTIYHALETRKRINEQLKNTIKPLCPVLMKGVVENLKTELETV